MRMEDNIEDSIKMIKNMDMEFSLGKMVENTKVNGIVENSMVKENSQHQVESQNTASGIKVKE